MKKDLIDEALQNIRDDRQKTEDFLKELNLEFQSGETSHSRSGVVAAKYLETLQRSNEQMVKIISIVKKEEEKEENLNFDKDEKENIFELIKEAAD
jgi:hypothetical protein